MCVVTQPNTGWQDGPLDVMFPACLPSGRPASHGRGGQKEGRGFGPAAPVGGAATGGRALPAGGEAEGGDGEGQGRGR